MRQFGPEQTLMDAVAANSGAFTATNATNTFNDTAHGLVNGDVVTVANSGGALPDGLTASTYYYVVNKTDNTFQLSLTPGGSAVAIADDGSGTNTWYQEQVSNVLEVSDYNTIVLAISTASSANVTLSVLGSIADLDDAPTWLSPAAVGNHYEFVGVNDYEDASQIDGDTGIAYSGTDATRLVEVNVNGLTQLAVKTKDFKAGAITITARGFKS